MHTQSPLQEIKESISYLLGVVFFGFIYAIGILFVLGIVLEWTLEIDITKYDTNYRLILLLWGLCAVGQHIYYKREEERKIEEQLELLRQGKSVSYPRKELMERWEREKKTQRFIEEYEQKEQQMMNARANNPFGLSEAGRMKFYKEHGMLGNKSDEEVKEVHAVFFRKNPNQNDEQNYEHTNKN
jgi:hypothetical protein